MDGCAMKPFDFIKNNIVLDHGRTISRQKVIDELIERGLITDKDHFESFNKKGQWSSSHSEKLLSFVKPKIAENESILNSRNLFNTLLKGCAEIFAGEKFTIKFLKEKISELGIVTT